MTTPIEQQSAPPGPHILLAQTGDWTCSCGHRLVILDECQWDRWPRLVCINHDCEHYEVRFQAPLAEQDERSTIQTV